MFSCSVLLCCLLDISMFSSTHYVVLPQSVCMPYVCFNLFSRVSCVLPVSVVLFQSMPCILCVVYVFSLFVLGIVSYINCVY